jgi:hypothetical protein
MLLVIRLFLVVINVFISFRGYGNPCSCLTGYTGTFCDIPTCGTCTGSGYACQANATGSPPACTCQCKNGFCNAGRTCTCNSGWTGTLCGTFFNKNVYLNFQISLFARLPVPEESNAILLILALLLLLPPEPTLRDIASLSSLPSSLLELLL